ncbi:hypothetical protein N7520_005466 [Penicillium odoratum]|uniref:uncharacterized protein n=1 Tax=Penicillium odoratum TaxID=1167516 RepID=UPI002548C4D6|nr:uncharacterized protein N7520_005466 [Penicillium odoratum]KAJ5765907.1 hypothetical protein N7520_005466 [Penicillium odoratum]
MSVPIALENLVSPVLAEQSDKSQPHLVLSSFDHVFESPRLKGQPSITRYKDGPTIAQKPEHIEPALHVDSNDHPLFPPLPTYGAPNFTRNSRYYAMMFISSILSLAFLTVIFSGALICKAQTTLQAVIPRLRGYRMALQQGSLVEERNRKLERADPDQEWHTRPQKKHVHEEQGPDECPPLEGSKDMIVCDVAYYARQVGLDVETFRVQTEDGFIITLWHVYDPQEYTALSPQQRRERGPTVFNGMKDGNSFQSGSGRRYPILLVHGLLQSAGAYCTNDDDSLAFFLCKSGYDVWLGNNRCGMNPEHATLSSSDPRMWSWDIRHLGTLDLTALTSRVLYETGFSKLGLVCHSQGTTETFVALAKEHRPELGERISVFCALAPAAYAGPLVRKSFFRFMQILSPALFRLVFGIHAFIPVMMTVRRYCNPKVYGTLAYWVFSFLFGWTDARWERDLRHRMFQFAPVYVSAESMRWWLGSESFAKHGCILSPAEDQNNCHRTSTGGDHGDDPRDPCLGSQREIPWFGPQVPPFAMWIGGSDALVDGQRLLRRFQDGLEPHVRVVHSKVIDEYEHLDVLWAVDAIEQVGKEVRQVLWTTMPEDARSVCRIPTGVHSGQLDG